VALLFILPGALSDVTASRATAPPPPRAPATAGLTPLALPRSPGIVAGPSSGFGPGPIVPGIGPSSRSLLAGRPLGPLPATTVPERAAASLPQLPSSMRSAPVLAPSPSGPTNINLSGNSTLTIASSTTVGNIALHNHSILYVHATVGQATLTVLGNIRLYGHSLFYVNRSNLVIGESYDVEWQIQVMGSAQFALAYSNLSTDGYQWGAAYEGKANVTIVGSQVGYPTGWLDSTLLDAARLTVLASWYSSDVILYDSPANSSTSNFTAAESAGFNIWLNFKAGTTANLSLPGVSGWRNWTFPGAARVSGVNYSVEVLDSFVIVFAVMLWQGANLTLTDSPDVAISLNIVSGTVNITGFEQATYARFGFYAGQFALTLWNATVLTWNIYPFAGGVRISDSQIGEIQLFDGTWASVHNSTLTADGGYYGNQGTSDLGIFDSTIAGQVVAYGGFTELENCTVNTSSPNRILATGTGRLLSLDTWVAPVDTFQAIGAGVANVAWSVHVNVTASAGAAAGAAVSLAWASNGTTAMTGATNASGGWSGSLVSESINATRTLRESYNGTVSERLSGAAWTVPVLTASAWYGLALEPLIAGSVPSNASTDVALSLPAIVLEFAQPMDGPLTAGLVTVAPALVTSSEWDAMGHNLTLAIAAPLAPSTSYAVTLLPGGRTASGIPIASVYVVAFETAAAVVDPAAASTYPANGTANVSVTTNISVTFTLPMNATLTTTALSVVLAAGSGPVAGTTHVTGTLLLFVPSAALEYNSTYRVTVATTARSAAGAPLASAIAFSFRTAVNTSGTGSPKGGTPGAGSSGAPGAPWSAYAAIGAVAAIAVALLLLRRRRPAPPAPAATLPPLPPPAWSEDETPSPPRNG